MKNGDATPDPTPGLRGWLIAFAGGMTLIGRRVDPDDPRGCPGHKLNERCPDRLSPVYALAVSVTTDARGRQAQANWQAGPVLLLSSFDSVVLPPGVVTKPCEEFDEGDRKLLFGAIQQAEGIAQQVRAAKAGVVIAGPGRG